MKKKKRMGWQGEKKLLRIESYSDNDCGGNVTGESTS